MELAIVFILGILAGLIISRILQDKPVGNLRVDHSDPDGPYLFLELHEDPDRLAKHKTVTLRVLFKDFLPRG